MLDLVDSRLFEAVPDSLETGVYRVDLHRKIMYWELQRAIRRIDNFDTLKD